MKVKGIVNENSRGKFISTEKYKFSIIDKRFIDKVKSGEEWEFKTKKIIRDRRGNSVPILIPIKRIENVIVTGKGVFYVSGHVEEKFTFKKAEERGLIKILEDKTLKSEFFIGKRIVKIKLKDGSIREVEDIIPLSKEEEEEINEERQKWLSIIENERKAIDLNELRQKRYELELKLSALEDELSELKNKPITVEFSYDWNAYTKNYLFLFNEGKIYPFEIISDSTPRLHYPGGRWEDFDTIEKGQIDWSNVPFSKEQIERALIKKKSEIEKRIFDINNEIKEVKNKIAEIDKQIGEMEDERSLATRIKEMKQLIMMKSETYYGPGIISRFPVEKDSILLSEAKNFPTKTPQGLILFLLYKGFIPESLKEEFKKYSEPLHDVIFQKWYLKSVKK